MKIYVPYYDNKWNIKEINTEAIMCNMKQFRILYNPGYPVSIIYFGTIYNGDNIFSNEIGAQLWIQKDFECNKYRIDFREVMNNDTSTVK